MKFAIYTKDLLDGLKVVAKCADPKPMTPILSAVKISADGGIVTLEATNLKLAARTVLPVHIEDGGTVCVNARYLLEVVNKLPEDTATFTLEGNSLHVNSGGRHFNLLTFDAEDFPSTTFNTEPKLEILIPVFKDILRKTIFAVSTEDDRPIFKGVNFNLKTLGKVGYRLQAFSTNTHRIACYLGGTLPKRDSDIGEFNIIIPPDALRMVNAAISNDPDDFLRLVLNEQTLTFKFNNVWIKTRLIEGEFPPVDKLLDDTNRTATATFNTLELKAALDAAKLVAKANEYNMTRLRLSENQIEVSATSHDRGDFATTIEAHCDSDIEIGFNTDYLLDYLGAADCSKVCMKYGDNVTSIKMSDSDVPDEFVYIVTPVRI